MKSWILAATTGFLCYLAVPPQDFFAMAWFAYLPLLWSHRNQTARKAFFLAWLAGSISNLGAFYWNYELMVTHSAIPPVGGLLLVLFMAVQQGVREALWLAISRHLSLKGRGPRWLVYATVYTACEFFYPHIFPLHLSNTQHSCLLTSQTFDLAGPAGLSFLIMSFNLALWGLLEGRKEHLVALGVLGFTLGYGAVRVHQVGQAMESAPRLKVGMVENGVGLVSSRDDLVNSMRLLQTLSAQAARQHQPELLVFPETAVKMPPPLHWVEGEPGPTTGQFYPLHLSRLQQDQPYSPQVGHRTALIFGTTARDHTREGPIPGRKAMYNAAFLVDEEGVVLGRALKNKLLLFGEFIPGARYFPWIYTKILTRASSLSPGTEAGVLDFKGHRIGVSICYEDILPGFSHKLARGRPELLVNLTNDAWFGETAEPALHLALSKARAIELRLYLVRSTTTGISAFIDPLGRVMKQSRPQGPQALVEEVGWMPAGTPFAFIGLGFAWFCVLVTVFWLWAARGATGSEDDISNPSS